MVHDDNMIRTMIDEYINGADEAELCSKYNMRRDKWSKIKNGSLRPLEGIEYPVKTNAEKEKREEIAAWLSGGESMAVIAREMRIPYSEVRRIAEDLKRNGLIVEKRAKGFVVKVDSSAVEVWDEWRYAYEEHKAEWCAHQLMMEWAYRARGIPTQWRPYPIAWEDLECRHSPSKGRVENKAAIEREVQSWLQTLLGD